MFVVAVVVFINDLIILSVVFLQYTAIDGKTSLKLCDSGSVLSLIEIPAVGKLH